MNRLGGEGPRGLNGRQAQNVGDDETAVDERPGHLAGGWRVTAPQDVPEVNQVIQREELIKPHSALIQLSDALQAVVLDGANRRLSVLPRGENGRQCQRLGERPPGLALEVSQRLRPGVCLGDRRDHRGALGPKDIAEVRVGGVLIKHCQRHRAVRRQGVHRLTAQARVREIAIHDIRRVGAGLAERALTVLAELDSKAQGDRAPADRFGQSRRSHVPDVAGDRFGPVGLQQLVEVFRIDPQ